MPNQNVIHVVAGCDENYAMPLAVTLRSAIDRLDQDSRLSISIIDGGISEESKQRLEINCRDERVTVEFKTVDLSLLADFPVSHHISVGAYLRLLIPNVLPKSVNRAIYLDSDLLVCQDLTRLWETPMNGHVMMAAQDPAAPFMDADVVIPQDRHAKKYFVAFRPVANYEQLGISPRAKYFNTGVLLIDVDRWQRDNLTHQFLACLDEHREHVLWWDQYVMNAVLHDQWGELDPRWNQGAQVHLLPSHRESPYDRDTYRAVLDDPWIIHFTSGSKPWHYHCSHPATSAFRRQLEQTPWADFQPERPPELLRDWWKHQTRSLKSEMRKKKAVIRYWIDPKRRAA